MSKLIDGVEFMRLFKLAVIGIVSGLMLSYFGRPDTSSMDDSMFNGCLFKNR